MIDTEVDYLNLFENPFLAYTADKVRKEIKPLLENNLELKYADYIKLREDTDLKLNELITDDGEDNDKKIADLSERGYLFAKENKEKTFEIARLNKSLIEKEKENITKDDKIRELESKLKKQNKKSEYMMDNRIRKKKRNGIFMSRKR